MTVKELKEQIQDVPDDAIVSIEVLEHEMYEFCLYTHLPRTGGVQEDFE